MFSPGNTPETRAPLPARLAPADYGTTSADQAAQQAADANAAQLAADAAGAAALGEAGAGIPVEAVPDLGQAEMTALLQNMYAQYQHHHMGAATDADLQAQLQQHLQQQQFLVQQAHMSPDDLAAMQVRPGELRAGPIRLRS